MNLKEKIKIIWHALEAPLTFLVLLSLFSEIFYLIPFNLVIINSSNLSSICAYLCLAMYLIPKYKKEKKGRVRKSKLSCNAYYFVLGFLSAAIFNIVLYYAFVIFLGSSGVTTTDGISRTLMFYLLTCILGPCIEELCFRAFPKIRLEKKFSTLFIIVFSSVVFALIHGSSILNVMYAFIFGIFLIYIYIKTNNLLYPILFHIGANSSSAVLEIFPMPSIDNLIYYLPILIVFICLSALILKNRNCLKNSK